MKIILQMTHLDTVYAKPQQPRGAYLEQRPTMLCLEYRIGLLLGPAAFGAV